MKKIIIKFRNQHQVPLATMDGVIQFAPFEIILNGQKVSIDYLVETNGRLIGIWGFLLNPWLMVKSLSRDIKRQNYARAVDVVLSSLSFLYLWGGGTSQVLAISREVDSVGKTKDTNRDPVYALVMAALNFMAMCFGLKETSNRVYIWFNIVVCGLYLILSLAISSPTTPASPILYVWLGMSLLSLMWVFRQRSNQKAIPGRVVGLIFQINSQDDTSRVLELLAKLEVVKPLQKLGFIRKNQMNHYLALVKYDFRVLSQVHAFDYARSWRPWHMVQWGQDGPKSVSYPAKLHKCLGKLDWGIWRMFGVDYLYEMGVEDYNCKSIWSPDHHIRQHPRTFYEELKKRLRLYMFEVVGQDIVIDGQYFLNQQEVKEFPQIMETLIKELELEASVSA